VTFLEQRWHAALQNWAVWIVSGGGHSRSSSCGVSTIYKGDDRFRADYVGPVVLIGAAHDVDVLVVQLPEVHRRALVAEFVWTGSATARALALGIHVDTLRNRVRQACYRLDDLHEARKAAQKRARAAQPLRTCPR
jgi:hypothetical protein